MVRKDIMCRNEGCGAWIEPKVNSKVWSSFACKNVFSLHWPSAHLNQQGVRGFGFAALSSVSACFHAYEADIDVEKK